MREVMRKGSRRAPRPVIHRSRCYLLCIALAVPAPSIAVLNVTQLKHAGTNRELRRETTSLDMLALRASVATTRRYFATLAATNLFDPADAVWLYPYTGR